MNGAELVGLTGIEPVTSSLSGTRSNQLSYKPNLIGGGSRIRTGDMLLAKQPLYQLSYTPFVGSAQLRKGGGTLRKADLGLRHVSTSPPLGGCSLERR